MTDRLLAREPIVVGAWGPQESCPRIAGAEASGASTRSSPPRSAGIRGPSKEQDWLNAVRCTGTGRGHLVRDDDELRHAGHQPVADQGPESRPR